MWLFFLFLFEFRRKLGEGGAIKFEFWWGVLIVRIGRYIWVTKQPQCPFGVQRLSTYATSARSARVWWDTLIWRSSKVSFKFLQTLLAFRTCLHILVYKITSSHLALASARYSAVRPTPFPPKPNLTSNFETHKNVSDDFNFVYKYIYNISKYPQSLKKFKGHFWSPSTRPIKLALRARPAFGLLRKAFGAGPRRDIVGA